MSDKPTMQLYTSATGEYEIRYEDHQGQKHLVVPVIMMTEGVHNGSYGPLYHSIEELGRWPDSWNGIPISVQHPSIDGNCCSANIPEIIDSEVVGRVYNTHVLEDQLRGEAWLNEERLRQISAETLLYLQERRPLDVSLGMFTDDEAVTGDWNGEQYIGVAHNHRPDHLALLPGATGACSWEDGCGIRNNEEGGETMENEELEKAIALAKAQIQNDYTVIHVNEAGMQELVQQMREKIDAMDTETRIHYLEELYDDHVIYRVVSRVAEGSAPVSKFVKRPYAYDNGAIEFTGEPVQVRRDVSYVDIPEANSQTAKEESHMSGKTNGNPCCEEKVELLIQSDHSTFVEADREWLNGQEKDVIDRLLGMQTNAENTASNKDNEVGGVVTKGQAIQVLGEQLSDPEKFRQLLPPELRGQFEHGMKLHEEHRDGLISKISTNTDVYTEDELKGMETNALEKLASAIKVPADYTALGGRHQVTGPTENTEEPLLPITD